MRIKVVLLGFFLISLCGCDTIGKNDDTIYFVGDSQIANWDTEYSFPNRITVNLGKDGAKIDYLSLLDIINIETIIIIEIGTNDIQIGWTCEQLEQYVERFCNQVNSISGKEKYIIEVLPTSNKEKNQIIKMFNQKIKQIFNMRFPKIVVIEAYDIFEENGKIKEFLTRDGLHLNDYGYRILTDKVETKLK